MTNLIVALLLSAYLSYGIYLWAHSKPKGRSWRCHAGRHDWDKYGYKWQCRRCPKRKNNPMEYFRMATRGLDRLLDKIGAMHAAKQQDWQTPTELFEWIQEELGFEFTLDPCTSPENNLGTPKFYTEKEDGLAQSWRGEKVYVNPPYGDLARWVKKCREESWDVNTIVVMLAPVRVSPEYMRENVWRSHTLYLYKLEYAAVLKTGEIGVYFMPKRVRFIDPNTGEKTGSPYFDSMVVVWR